MIGIAPGYLLVFDDAGWRGGLASELERLEMLLGLGSPGTPDVAGVGVLLVQVQGSQVWVVLQEIVRRKKERTLLSSFVPLCEKNN